MHVFAYRATVLGCEPERAMLRLDLGFRVYRDESLPLVEPPPDPPPDDVRVEVWEEDGRVVGKIHDLQPGVPAPRLWRYPAVLMRVIDGDTLDARVTIYPGLEIEERFRLGRIDAPELFGVRKTDPEYGRGVAARDFVLERILANGGEMLISTDRRGKWRRWVAEVSLADSTRLLSDELVEEGLACWFETRARARVPARTRLAMDAELHRRLADRASELQVSPDELVHIVVTEYLASAARSLVVEG
jgi:micrococcal nuclease